MILKPLPGEESVAFMKNTTEYELIRFMNDWGNLSGRRDTATLALMLPDDFRITMANGAVLDKTQYLDNFQTIRDDYSVTDYDQQTQLFGTTAIVRARYLLAVGELETRLCYTATFVKRREKWEVVALHSSPLAIV